MPSTTILQGVTVNKKTGAGKDTTQTVSVTHNNSRLYTHTDGETYERVGVDGSGNLIYRNTRIVRS